MKSVNQYMVAIEAAKTKEELAVLHSEYSSEKSDIVKRKNSIKEKIALLEKEYNELDNIAPNFAIDIRSDILLRIGKIELERLLKPAE